MDYLLNLAKSEAGKQLITAVGQQVTEAVRRTVDEKDSTLQSTSSLGTEVEQEVNELGMEDLIDLDDKSRNPKLMWPLPVDATEHYKVHTIVSPIFSIAEYINGHALIHRPTSTVVYYNDDAARIDDLSVLWSEFSDDLRVMDEPLATIHDLILLILYDKEKGNEAKPVYFAILTSMYSYCSKARESFGKRFSMSATNKYRDTPVHVAAQSGDVEMLKMMWDDDFLTFAQNSKGRTINMCTGNNKDIENFVNSKCSSEEMGELIYIRAFSTAVASHFESPSALRRKFERQRQADYPRLSSTKFWKIIRSQKYNCKDIEKILASCFAQNPNFLGEVTDGKTIFHNFSDVPYMYQKTLLLFASKSMLNSGDAQGRTPAHYIAKNGTLSAFILLWSHGLDINKQDKTGYYPMDYALARDHVYLTKAFLVFDGTASETVYTKVISKESNKKSVKLLLEQFNASYHTILPKMANYNFNVPTHRRCREMSSIAEEDLIALSIDGGGMKGVIALQVLKEIEKIKGRDFLSWFNLIGGTSTGSIIALGLTKFSSSDQVMRTYFRLKDEIFAGGRPYSGEELEKALLAEFGDVDLSKLADLKNIRLAIPVARVDVTPPVLCMFRSYSFKHSTEADLPEWSAAKVVRASCAAPSYFPPVDQKFMDGGLIANNPTLDILADCQRISFETNNTIKPKIIVSIGTGSTSKKCDNVEIVKPTSVSGVISAVGRVLHLKDVFIDQITASDITVQRSKWMAEAMGMAHFRFSPTLDTPIAIDEQDDKVLIDALLSVKFKVMDMRNEMLMLSSILK